MPFAIFAFAALASLASILATASPPPGNPVTVFAHMVSTPNAVRWALTQGANAVEMDLQFSGIGNVPVAFGHSLGLEPCDCTCACPIGSDCPAESVCNVLWNETGNHCKAQSTAQDMTWALGSSEISSKLVAIYIDSKVNSSMIDSYGGGVNVVNLLNRNVMSRGYKGQIIISVEAIKYADYLRGAARAAAQSPFVDQYFFTYDFEADNEAGVWDALVQLGTNNIAYSMGIGSCSNATYYAEIQSAVARNWYAGVGIWTLDSVSSMGTYLDYGVTSIMTNKPSVAVRLIKSRLDYIPTPAQGPVLVPHAVQKPCPTDSWQCDCNYHIGGCTISRSPPPNTACRCSYKGFWTCGGSNVHCSDPNNVLCKYPTGAKDTCEFGGGDCGGY